MSLRLFIVPLALAICLNSRGDEQPERSKELYRHFAETAKSFTFTSEDDERYAFQKAPLMQFALEGSTFGSVFVWKDATQRLALIGTIGSIPINGLDWEFIEFHLLRPKPIQAVEISGRPNKTWRPDVDALELKPIPKAPPIASVARSRLVQMRALARQFSGTMETNGKPNQLRLLPQPLYRQDQSSKTLDSALFALVHDLGTDPEILLRIETVEHKGTTTWHYQPIRFTWRKLSLSLNGTNVWKADEFREREIPLQTTPYVTGLTNVVP